MSNSVQTANKEALIGTSTALVELRKN